MKLFPTNVNLTGADETEALLPWLVTGRLTAGEQARVAAYFEAHPAVVSHVALAREERDGSVAGNEAIAAPSPAALDRLMAAVAVTPQPRRLMVPSVTSVWDKFAALLGNLTPRTMGLAASAAAVVIMAQAITIGTLLPREGGRYFPESGPETAGVANGLEVLVALQPGAAASAFTSALVELNATVIDGPRSGLYRLRIRSGTIDTAVANQTIANLKAHPDVFAFVGRVAVKP